MTTKFRKDAVIKKMMLDRISVEDKRNFEDQLSGEMEIFDLGFGDKEVLSRGILGEPRTDEGFELYCPVGGQYWLFQGGDGIDEKCRVERPEEGVYLFEWGAVAFVNKETKAFSVYTLNFRHEVDGAK